MSHILKLDALKSAEVSTAPYPYFVVENSLADDQVQAIIQDFPKIEQGGSYNIEDVEIKPNFDRFLKSLDCKEFRQILTEKFDVDVMESITNIPAPSEDMKGKVIDEVQKGYKLGDKVIRFAKVVVGN